MIPIAINGLEYRCASAWEDLPLSKAILISKLIHNEMPVHFKKLYALYLKGGQAESDIEIEKLAKEITDEEFIKTFPVFYGKCLSLLSDIPDEVIAKISGASRSNFYNQYLYKFVFGLLHIPIDCERKFIKSFTWQGVEYYLPESKKYPGEDRPMFDRTAIEFAESADLELFSKELEGGKFERAANIIAILCRPKGEPYNESICLMRAEYFAELPMNIVWEVFFCFTQQLILSQQSIAISLLEQAQKAIKQELAAA